MLLLFRKIVTAQLGARSRRQIALTRVFIAPVDPAHRCHRPRYDTPAECEAHRTKEQIPSKEAVIILGKFVVEGGGSVSHVRRACIRCVIADFDQPPVPVHKVIHVGYPRARGHPDAPEHRQHDADPKFPTHAHLPKTCAARRARNSLTRTGRAREGQRHKPQAPPWPASLYAGRQAGARSSAGA
jgi:hypothetical protein